MAGLKTLHESSWSTGRPSQPRAYRITVVPTWFGPGVLRVEENADGTGLLVVKTARDQSNVHQAGPISHQVQVTLTPQQMKAAGRLLDQIDLVHPTPTADGYFDGLDGVVYWIEARDGHSYHVIHRWSPSDWLHPPSPDDLAKIHQWAPDIDINGYLQTSWAVVKLNRMLVNWSNLSDEDAVHYFDVCRMPAPVVGP